MELSQIRAIGEKREKEFNKLGITCAEDLIRYYPRAYLDLTERASLATAYNNDMVLVKCEVTRIFPVNFGHPLKMVRANCTQDGYPFSVVWFNQPYVASRLQPDEEYLFYGRIQNKFGQITMTNPTFEKAEKNDYLKGILPVYTLTGGLYQKSMQKIVNDAIFKTRPKRVIPDSLIKKI